MTAEYTTKQAKDTAGISRRSRKLGTPLLVLCIIGIACACIFVSAPASAGTKYMAGSPVLSASISGTNEFSPGDTVTVPIRIENTGLNQFKFVQSSIVDRDDLPNTAKFLTVTLGAGNAPLIVKSDPQMVGDLKGSQTAICSYTVRILSDAPAGTYQLPVDLSYSYLYTAEQYGTETIEYYYKSVNETITLPITIKPRVQIDVISTEAGDVNAGTEGTVLLTVQNTGHEDGKKTVLKIARNDNSPVVPSQSSVYVGDFPVGATASGTFRISVSSDAEEQVYPLDVFVTYEDNEGDTVTSDTETIGIPVGGKVAFAIVSDPAEMTTGQKKVITILYQNTGGATVYNAQARISAVDPFTCSDDVAFLGTVEPGETKEAAYEISVDSSATEKEYGIDSEVRYRDALDNSRVTDPLKVRIRIEANPGIAGTITNNPLIAGGIIAAAIAAIGIYAFWYRKRLR